MIIRTVFDTRTVFPVQMFLRLMKNVLFWYFFALESLNLGPIAFKHSSKLKFEQWIVTSLQKVIFDLGSNQQYFL